GPRELSRAGGDRVGEGAGSPGDAHEPGRQGHPHPEAALGSRPHRRVHGAPDGGHRRPRARVRGRDVPSPREHGAPLHRPAPPPISIGGPVRKIGDWKRGSESESDAGPGVLYSSGLVAGGSIMGLAASFLSAPDWPRVQWLAEKLAFGKEALPAALGFALFLG